MIRGTEHYPRTHDPVPHRQNEIPDLYDRYNTWRQPYYCPLPPEPELRSPRPIRWARVFAVLFALVAIILLVMNFHEIGVFVKSMKNIGPGHTPEEMTIGILCLGIISIATVAIVRLLTQGNR